MQLEANRHLRVSSRLQDNFEQGLQIDLELFQIALQLLGLQGSGLRHTLDCFVDASQAHFDEGTTGQLFCKHASLGRSLQHCLDLDIFAAWRPVNIVQDYVAICQAMLDLHDNRLILLVALSRINHNIKWHFELL